jgi:hypothetical protein
MMSISYRLRRHVFQKFTKSVASSRRLALGIFLGVFALPASLMAQAGSLDPTFGIGGIVTTASTGAMRQPFKVTARSW